MTRAKKAAATAVLNTWKFQKGDTVMIARGRNKGRVATITQIQRDGNSAAGRGRPIPKHKRERWKTNPKVFLDGKAHSGRRILRGGRSVDVDRPVPISNVCHVAQRTIAGSKSSYKCVRVEFIQDQVDPSVKHRVLKIDPETTVPSSWTKKQRPPPRTKRVQSAKFITADVAHERTFFPSQRFGAPVSAKLPRVSRHTAMYHTATSAHFSSFASQTQRRTHSSSCDFRSARPTGVRHQHSAVSMEGVWDELMKLQHDTGTA